MENSRIENRRKRNIIGIITLTSIICLVLLAIIIRSQAELVKAFYVKLAMVSFASVVISIGVYLMDTFCTETNRKLKIGIAYFGAFLGLIALLSCLDILPFLRSWNWLVSGGILYIMLIQLQLLNWGKKNHNVVRFSTLFVILSDVFLIFFFIAKWRSPALEIWINIATVLSIALTLFGLVILQKNQRTTEIKSAD